MAQLEMTDNVVPRAIEQQLFKRLGFYHPTESYDEHSSKEIWGKYVDQVVRDGSDFDTPHALNVLRQSTLNDPTICTLMKRFVHLPGLSRRKVVGSKTSGIFCSLQNTRRLSDKTAGNKTAGLHILLWSSNSEGTIYACSHDQVLNAVDSKFGFWSIPRGNLDKLPSIIPISFSFPTGGRLLTDARLGFSIDKGYVVVLLFLAQEERHGWEKWAVKISEQNKDIVVGMEAEATQKGIEMDWLKIPYQ
ncbi:MAG: hypothetical protein M1835_006936 [Candelina submexicana]|nr:MAG: hypothetical protein M1835_006936 [Candelina submexicana]